MIRRVSCDSTRFISITRGYGCFNLKYIPTYIPTEAVKGLTKGEIAKCKLNWVLKQNKEAFKTKLSAITSALTHEH